MMDIDLCDSIEAVPAPTWERLRASLPQITPFTSHRFLSALESSHSTGTDQSGTATGWTARPLLLRDGGKITAALPLYVKSHSQGEYVFDHSWADAYMRAGGQYYPKLQVAAPFTPVTGRRFLGPDEAIPDLAHALAAIAAQNGLSSAHISFCTAHEAQRVAQLPDWLHRKGLQYHWFNRGYRDFDDFLAGLSSQKRKMIRKERAALQGQGLTIRALQGDAITPAHWDAFWQFYQDTGARKWGRPYLTRAAFRAFHHTMRDEILLILAFTPDGEAVAGALNFIGPEALYGRYWGALCDVPFLHFELCYYRAIDWAIAHGLSRVEAGAQGEHKIARGYEPVQTHSLHWIADAGFRRAVAAFVAAEAEAVTQEGDYLRAHGPFRQSPDPESGAPTPRSI